MVPVPVDGEDVDPLAPPGPELTDPVAVPLLVDDEEDPELVPGVVVLVFVMVLNTSSIFSRGGNLILSTNTSTSRGSHTQV
jgi:hypothetical protein